MIRAIVFDLGNVLIPFDWKRGYEAFAQASLYPADEVRRRIKETDLFESFELGRVEPRIAAGRISSLLGLNVTFDQFRRIWSSIFLPESILGEDMLAGLHTRYRLLLLSNTDAIHYGWIRENYPILRHFDDAVLSFELGLRKPEPGIYRDAVARACCEPGEMFFTDDREENVVGARQVGIDAVQFQSAGQLEQELHDRGVEW